MTLPLVVLAVAVIVFLGARVVAGLHRNMSSNPIAKGLRKITPPISDRELSGLADAILQRCSRGLQSSTSQFNLSRSCY